MPLGDGERLLLGLVVWVRDGVEVTGSVRVAVRLWLVLADGVGEPEGENEGVRVGLGAEWGWTWSRRKWKMCGPALFTLFTPRRRRKETFQRKMNSSPEKRRTLNNRIRQKLVTASLLQRPSS